MIKSVKINLELDIKYLQLYEEKLILERNKVYKNHIKNEDLEHFEFLMILPIIIVIKKI